MRRALTIFLFAVLTAGAAQACKCAVIPFDQAVANAQLVVKGSATMVVAGSRDGNQQIMARFRVTKRIKGPRVGRWINVYTQGSTAACGYYFEEGRRIILGAMRDPDGKWRTSSCIMASLNQ